jgi:hypothetical protein
LVPARDGDQITEAAQWRVIQPESAPDDDEFTLLDQPDGVPQDRFDIGRIDHWGRSGKG